MRSLILLATTSCVLLTACVSTAQLSANTDATDFSLDPLAFKDEGIGFLTPIAATGQEADRVALALAFADSLAGRGNDLKVVSLPEVLSAVNRASLSSEYRRMTDDYQATGIMEKETLRKVGEVSGARYLGLLELAKFEQEANRRFGIGGLRLMDTKTASIRLALQIWDSQSGAIAWEGSDEIHYAYDTSRERPVTFGFVADKAAANLVGKLLPSAETAVPVAVNAAADE